MSRNNHFSSGGQHFNFSHPDYFYYINVYIGIFRRKHITLIKNSSEKKSMLYEYNRIYKGNTLKSSLIKIDH